ncbi:MAG: hypothetical protein R3C11_17515 [Planctomycetaceae bacterium]
MKKIILGIALILSMQLLCESSPPRMLSPTDLTGDPLEHLAEGGFPLYPEKRTTSGPGLPFAEYKPPQYPYWNRHYFYKGDSEELNKFLARCEPLLHRTAQAQKITDSLEFKGRGHVIFLQVVLHSGPGYTKIPSEFGKITQMKTDWELEVGPGALSWGHRIHSWELTIHVWLDDQIRLEELKIPKEFSVVSGGEIEAFIKNREPVNAEK